MSCYDENMLSMSDYLYQVRVLNRHPHEFLADMIHSQSAVLDEENIKVQWIDLYAIQSPILFINGANTEDSVNVRFEYQYGWAFQEMPFLCATKDIPIGSELLDSYML